MQVDLQFCIIQYLLNQLKDHRKMFNDHFDQIPKQSAFRKLSAQEPDVIIADEQMGVTNQMLQVINAQNTLIMKLLQRQNLLYQELNKRLSSSDSGSRSPLNEQNNKQYGNGNKNYPKFNYSSQYSDSSHGSQKNKSNKPQIKIIQSIGIEGNKITNFQTQKQCAQPDQNNGKDQNNQNEDFVFLEDELESHKYQKKQTETKNMIKNFAKGIFNFIKKNRDKRLLVLNELGITEQQFMKVFFELKGKIHSLSQLRSLWMTNGNIYNKAFRILSSLYLRKYCLEKTFNSRIQNYGIHMKYRHRLREGIANPEEFTVLKTN